MANPKSFTHASSALTRRQFLCLSALAAGSVALTGCATYGRPRRLRALDKLNLGVIGAGGKGVSDTDRCASENIVAICDVDEKQAAGQLKKYPGAKFYRDWRVMLEKEKTLDAVIISAPDHVHAPAAAAAMKLGKHVYVQKPLTHSVYEARYLRDLARKTGVVTQMGNQGSAEDGLRRAVEVVQAGVLGPVRQVHVWSNRPIWPQGMGRPPGSDPVPPHLDWDLWLGPAPWRPYKAEWPAEMVAQSKGRRGGAVYHPFAWRGWQDFGTGALGDMACHTANMPFRALKLGYPTEIEAESTGMNCEMYPLSSKIRFEFPARENLPAATFWWYDGGWKPHPDLTRPIQDMLDKVPDSGCLLIGDKGILFSPDDYGARFFIKLKDDKELRPGPEHEAVRPVPQVIPRNQHPGDTDTRHHLEWIAACKGGPKCYSDFENAAYLTEIILLGCVALRVGRKLKWDGPNMRAKNAPAAAQFIRRPYRRGWTL